MPADTGYGCKMVDGVVHVYTKKTNMDKYVSNNVFINVYIITLVGLNNSVLLFRSSELDLPYPDLKEYIADMNVMMALIINGPVWVFFYTQALHLYQSTDVIVLLSQFLSYFILFLASFQMLYVPVFTGSLSATVAYST